MYISKFKFFSRQNKKVLYNSYKIEMKSFMEVCDTYISLLKLFRKYITDYSDNKFIFKKLQNIEYECTCMNQEKIAHVYSSEITDLSYDYSVKNYTYLPFNRAKIERANATMRTMIEFLNDLECDDFIITQNIEKEEEFDE